MQDETLVEDAAPTVLETMVLGAPGGLVAADILGKFEESKINRKQAEARWLKSYQNFRGRYGDEVEFTDTEVSRVFIKVTKTKTLAAYGQLLDVLLGGPMFPISVGAREAHRITRGHPHRPY